MVEGELQSKSWKLDNGFYRNIVEIKAKRIQFLNKKKNTESVGENNLTESRHIMEEDVSFTDPYSNTLPLAAGSSDMNSDENEGFDQPGNPDNPDGLTNGFPGMGDATL